MRCRPTFPQFTNHAILPIDLLASFCIRPMYWSILPIPYQKCYGTLSEIHQWHFVQKLYQTCWAWILCVLLHNSDNLMNANHLKLQQLYLVYCSCYLQNKIYCIIDTFDNKPAPSRCYISSFSCNNCYDSLLCLQNQLFSCIQTWLHYCFVTVYSVYSSIDWKHRMPMPVPISRYMILKYSTLKDIQSYDSTFNSQKSQFPVRFHYNPAL